MERNRSFLSPPSKYSKEVNTLICSLGCQVWNRSHPAKVTGPEAEASTTRERRDLSPVQAGAGAQQILQDERNSQQTILWEHRPSEKCSSSLLASSWQGFSWWVLIKNWVKLWFWLPTYILNRVDLFLCNWKQLIFIAMGYKSMWVIFVEKLHSPVQLNNYYQVYYKLYDKLLQNLDRITVSWEWNLIKYLETIWTGGS